MIVKLSENDVIRYLRKYYGMLGIDSIDVQSIDRILNWSKHKGGIDVFTFSRAPIVAILKRCHKTKYKITIKK